MDTAQLIEVYSIGFYVCLGITILGFALAIFFFLFFDIPTVFALMTGRAQKKTIERIEKRSAKIASVRTSTGNLSGGLSGGLTGGLSGEMTGDFGRTEPITPAPMPQGLAGDAVPELQPAPMEGAAETAVLMSEGSSETTVLSGNGIAETSVLSAGAAIDPPPATQADLGGGATTILRQPETAVSGYPGSFILTEDIVIIHSDEQI